LRSRAPRSLDATAKVAHSTSLPQANVEAGYDFTNPNRRIVPWTARWEDTWTVGINVSIAAFDGGRASAATAQAQAQAEAARHSARGPGAPGPPGGDVESPRRRLGPSRDRRGRTQRRGGARNVRVSQDSYREGVIPPPSCSTPKRAFSGRAWTGHLRWRSCASPRRGSTARREIGARPRAETR
jgi:hypothetical protein